MIRRHLRYTGAKVVNADSAVVGASFALPPSSFTLLDAVQVKAQMRGAH